MQLSRFCPQLYLHALSYSNLLKGTALGIYLLQMQHLCALFCLLIFWYLKRTLFAVLQYCMVNFGFCCVLASCVIHWGVRESVFQGNQLRSKPNLPTDRYVQLPFPDPLQTPISMDAESLQRTSLMWLKESSAVCEVAWDTGRPCVVSPHLRTPPRNNQERLAFAAVKTLRVFQSRINIHIVSNLWVPNPQKDWLYAIVVFLSCPLWIFGFAAQTTLNAKSLVTPSSPVSYISVAHQMALVDHSRQ